MKILVTGASGLIGSALPSAPALREHEVVGLKRSSDLGSEPAWNPETGEVSDAALKDAVAIVHLAGEGMATGRWTTKRKLAIRDSRVEGTHKLCQWLAARPERPPVMIAASALGFYGDRGSTALDESSEPGTGFLAGICQAWEEATLPLADAGTRVVNLRMGVVLSAKGGALARMRMPFRLGLGGVVGDGEQYISWITLADLLGTVHHCIITDTLSGPVNATAPNPATNRVFTKTLGEVLKRPTVVPLPAFAARLLLGEMANGLLLASTRVIPLRLMDAGYKFEQRELEPALRSILA